MGTLGNYAWMMSIGIVLLILGIEIFLSRRKRIVWGIMPIVLIFISLIGLGMYTKDIQNDNIVHIATHQFNQELTAEIKLLENKNRIISYSHMSIKNSEGEIVDIEPFYIDDHQAVSRYSTSSNYFYQKYKLTGESQESKTVNRDLATFNWTSISASFFFNAAFMLNIPLIVILFMIRKQMRQKRIAAEMKKLNFGMGLG